MAGFIPNEGETLISQIATQRTHLDRDSNLELGLFTNSSPGETITEATISEPGFFPGYARITLTDGNWTTVGDTSTYAQQSFSPTADAGLESVYGYFIATKSATGTPRLLYVEVDSSGPYTPGLGDTYNITPTVKLAG